MEHDPIGQALFGPVVQAYRDLGVVATDPDDNIVAHATAMAFRFDTDGRRTLPDKGWDQALIWAHRDLALGVEPDTACALEVSIHTEWRGHGLSQLMVGAMRDAARAAGYKKLLAPVRPSEKRLEPDTDMEDYAHRTRGRRTSHRRVVAGPCPARRRDRTGCAGIPDSDRNPRAMESVDGRRVLQDRSHPHSGRTVPGLLHGRAERCRVRRAERMDAARSGVSNQRHDAVQ